MSPLTVIDNFEVPAGQEEEFFTVYKQVQAYMSRQAGYLGNKVYQALSPSPRYRFVNVPVPVYESAEALEAARDGEFRSLASEFTKRGFSNVLASYEVVHEGVQL